MATAEQASDGLSRSPCAAKCSAETSASHYDNVYSKGTFSQHAAGRGQTAALRLHRAASDSDLSAAEASASRQDRGFARGTYAQNAAGRGQADVGPCAAEASALRHTQQFARGTYSQHATGREQEQARDQRSRQLATMQRQQQQQRQISAIQQQEAPRVHARAAKAQQDIQNGHDDTTPQATEQQAQQQGPACFVITHSVAKRHNVGTIARCATAFGVRQLCLVGARQFNTFGSHGSDAYVDFAHYNTLEQCAQHLRATEGCSIVGVEIVEGAKPVHMHPFKGPTAFMLGNEGQGLSPRQMALCDSFVYIPQHGSGTASLNVAVACSIVLHHFAIWAEYSERDREGSKFVVAPRQQRTRPRGIAGDPEEVRIQRAARRQQSDSDDADTGLGGWLDTGDTKELTYETMEVTVNA